MKIISAILGFMAVGALTVTTACGNSGASNEKSSDNVEQKGSNGDPTHRSLSIRYVDGDSISANYEFAKDIQKAMLRAQSKQENAEKAKGAELQKVAERAQALATQIDTKMRNNGYLSEVSLNSDKAKYEQMMMQGDKMQQSAQAYLANLARSSQNEIMQLQIQLNDSIESFIKDYNAQHHYDAILYKAAGVYFDKSLDITDEVIKGLNERYKKKGDK